MKLSEINSSHSLDFGSMLSIVDLILNYILAKALMWIEETSVW
jgi:hypothetical protein